MRSYIQFVTVPTGDTPGTCIVLHFDDRRYVFGQVAEGTTRAHNELSLSLRKAQRAFITGKVGTQSTSGLLGFLLSIADATAASAQALAENKSSTFVQEDFEVYGPPNFIHSIAAARRFIFRKSLLATLHDCDAEQVNDGPIYADAYISVFALPIKPSGSSSTLSGMPTASEDEENANAVRKRVVRGMFSSGTYLDTLVEKRLSEVQLPAAIWVRNPATKDLEPYDGPLPTQESPKPDPDPLVLVRNPWPASKVSSLPPTRPREEAVSYIVQGTKRRGKFDVAKAKALQVPPGPNYSLLAGGQSIEINGKTITPDMVLKSDIQGGGFAILDIPSAEYLDTLVSRPEWTNDEITAGVNTYVWILGPDVSSSPTFQRFVQDRPDIQHVLSSSDHVPNRLSMHGAAESATKLASIDSNYFPIPYHDNKVLPQPGVHRPGHWLAPTETDISNLAMPNVLAARRGLVVQLDPNRIINEQSSVPDLEIGKVLSPALQGFSAKAKAKRDALLHGYQRAELDLWRAHIPHKDAEIITLGTGSALPSKHRNVSATLVRVPGQGSYLLDAGEDTLGQLKRVFNPEELKEVFHDLRLIWLSHGHADHHLGLTGVIKAWHGVVHGARSTTPPLSESIIKDLMNRSADAQCSDVISTESGSRSRYLAVAGGVMHFEYLREMSQVEDFGFSHVLYAEPHVPDLKEHGWTRRVKIFSAERKDKFVPTKSQCLALLGVSEITAVWVTHCLGAMAVSLNVPNSDGEDFKVAYSGDCRPSTKFAEFARDATVLIHEATFGNDLKGEAKAKKHSTMEEAIGVATLMKAKALVLTHFSQRYPKIPVIDDITSEESRLKLAKTVVETRESLAQTVEADEDEIAPMEEEIEPAASETLPAPANSNDVPATASNTGQDQWSEDVMDTGPCNSKVDLPLRIVFAFDYMRVKMGDFPILEAYRSLISDLFQADEEDEEGRRRAAAAELDRTLGRGKRQKDEKAATDAENRKGDGKANTKGKRKRQNSICKPASHDAKKEENGQVVTTGKTSSVGADGNALVVDEVYENGRK